MPADWDDWQLEEEPPVDPRQQERIDFLFDLIIAGGDPPIGPTAQL